MVLDTSVVLYDALSLKAFPKADVYIPLCVIEEIDSFKRDMGENGRNARHFSRFMDTLRNRGSLKDGVPLDTGSFVYVPMPESKEEGMNGGESQPANGILAAALLLQKQFPEAVVELITKNINLRLKSDAFGVKCRDYDPDHLSHRGEMYSGYRRLDVKKEQIKEFLRNSALTLENIKLHANQYVVLKCEDQTALGRYDKGQRKVVPLVQLPTPLWRIHPRNAEQSLAFDALCNEAILFVSLVGKAGTGKTLLALAAGLHKTLDEGKYQRLLVSRPIFPMGRDMGYLPGDIDQKLNPWMRPIFDSLEFIMGMGKKASKLTQDLMDQGLLSIEPLAYIRGRSLPRQYLIVDEAQNLTPHEIKTIVTRAGQGTKVVLTGDCYQIDNPYVDASNSGLAYSLEKFKGEEIAAHITLEKGERSTLAELAANRL